MISQMLTYYKGLYSFSGNRIYYIVLLMVLVSLLEGIGILFVIPLLAAAGMFPATVDSSSFLYKKVTHLLQYFSEDMLLFVVLVFYIIIITLISVLKRHQNLLQMDIKQGYAHDLRTSLFRDLTHAKWSFILRKRKSDFSHLLTTEVLRVANGTGYFLQLVAAVIFIMIQITLSFWVSVQVTLIVIGCGALVAFQLRHIIMNAQKIGKQMSSLMKNYFSTITEHLNGIKEIKSHAVEKRYTDQFSHLSTEIVHNFVSLHKENTKINMLFNIMAAFVISMIIYVSLTFLNVSTDRLLLLILLFARMWPRFSNLQVTFHHIVSMLPAFQAINEIKELAKEEVEFVSSTNSRVKIKNEVRFQNVTFSFHDTGGHHPTIQNMNVSIPSKGITALIGHSGAGKSTIADLVLGLIYPQEGTILVDQTSLSMEMLGSWRNSVSYVPQDPILINGTIEENLCLFKEYTMEDLHEVLEKTSCQFVHTLKNGIHSQIGDKGAALSGGERQRIVLARALLKKPSFLILDEATNALDYESEQKIMEVLKHISKSLPVLVIAHHQSVIQHADRVIALENGRLMKLGAVLPTLPLTL